MQDVYLSTYLNDHLGASVAGIELTRRCLSNNTDSELGKFLETFLLTLQDNQVHIRKLLRRLGAPESVAKKLGGWTIEKIGRLKLNNAILRYSDLSRVIELETLLVGLQAEISLWSVLEKYRSTDARFEGIDLKLLRTQSEDMREGLKEHHSRAAELAFANTEPKFHRRDAENAEKS
jgi:hypothetical protein